MALFDQFKKGLEKTRAALSGSIGGLFSAIDDDFYDDLEEMLIVADMGVATAGSVVRRLRERVRQERLRDPEEIRAALRTVIAETLSTGDTALRLDSKPAVVLFIGVNGVGKTTTIGKLAHQLKQEGKRVLLAAGDTFRAAAADQLGVWADRGGIEIVRQGEGADPAAVMFDAINAGKARGVDVILADTAGRLHTKQNLMHELNKIHRIILRELPDTRPETLLVIDATTGQNGLVQAKQFAESAGITGLVLTKLDGTAKGGVAVAIASELGIPVKCIGVGEGIDDLMPFDAAAFAEALI